MAEGGTLRPTSLIALALGAVVGIAGGWLLHPVSDRLGSPPLITWAQPVLLFLVAAILGAAAWATWRVLHVRRERLLPGQAVNRLILARACALVAAPVAGGYLGYGLSWIGDQAELADERLARSLVAALGGLLVVVFALLLERSCRVRKDDAA